MILTPTSGPEGIGTDKTGDIVDTTKKEEVEKLSNTKTGGEIDKKDEVNKEKGDNSITAMKKKLFEPETKNIKETPKNIIPEKDETEKSLGGKTDKETKEGYGTFEKGLDNMLEAGIITNEEKLQIIEDLKDPEVRQSINTRMSVRGTSVAYTVMNSYMATPLTAFLGGNILVGIAVWISLYILKRFIILGVVQITGRKLERKNYISNISLVPIIGEHAALIELYKKHPITSKYAYAFGTTRWKRRKFNRAETEETKKANGEIWKKEALKKTEWLEKRSSHRINLNNSIAEKTKQIIRGLQNMTGKNNNL